METATPQQDQNGRYEIIRANTYAQGVAELRKRGEEPKTFKENIKARVIAYENGDKSLFNIWLDSCTAVVNEAYSTKFKIVPQSNKLIIIPENFKKPFLPVMYSNVDGVQLDLNKGKYNHSFRRDEVLHNDGWYEIMNGDIHLLKTYRDIIFHEVKNEEAMAFFVRRNTDKDNEDKLGAFFVSSLLDGGSIADGSHDLDEHCSFLLGSPVRRVVGAAHGKIESSPSIEQRVARLHTRDEILTIARPLVAKSLWDSFTKIIPEEAPVTGDVLQRAADDRYFSPHSWEEFKKEMEKL